MLRLALLVSLFFHLILLAGSRQFVLPLHLPGSQKAVALKLSLIDAQERISERQQLSENKRDLPARTQSVLVAQKIKKAPRRVFPAFLSSTAISASVTTEIERPVRSRNTALSVAGNKASLSSGADGMISADGIRRYRLSLARAARQYQTYPQQARESGWQGKVVLKIQAGLAGTTPQVELEHSSGFNLLDSEALTMMQRAVHLAVLPENLYGKPFSISQPVYYSLDD